MRLSVKHIATSLVLCCVSLGLFAQEKTLAYYNTHESEILPDAQATFKKSDYERAIELCKWYFIIFGDDKADSLRKKSERCAQLSKEMNDLKSNGDLSDAKLKASAILSLNPDDAEAKAVSLIKIPEPVPIDTTVVKPPVVPVESVATEHEEAIQEEEAAEPVQAQVDEVVVAPDPVETEQHITSDSQPFNPRTRFVLKAGASIIDMKQISQSIAPGGTLGLYDIGGSPFGGEIGAYFCPGLSDSSASLFGLDSSIVLRAGKSVYPKLTIGYFSCKPTTENASSTSGMCAGAGVTFVLGGHFCLEMGAKYCPEILSNGYETVSANYGASYLFPTVIQISGGGIAPFVSFGWSF